MAGAAVAVACARQPPSGSGPVPGAWSRYELSGAAFAIAFEDRFAWIGTDRGLLEYDLAADRVAARFVAGRRGLVSNAVTSIWIDRQGRKWVGTHGGGVSILEDVLTPASLPGRERERGERRRSVRWRQVTVPDLPDPYVYAISPGRDGRVWVATWKGVAVYDGRAWTQYTTQDGLINGWVYALAVDRDGSLWFGTEGGVSHFDGSGAHPAGRWESFTHAQGLGADRSALGAPEAIDTPELHHDPTSRRLVGGYNPDYVIAVAIDPAGAKWFGTWGAGVSRLADGRWTSFTVRDGLPGNVVSDLHTASDGRLWAATDGGAAFFDGKRWHAVAGDDPERTGTFTVAEDPGFNLWFGSVGSISRLDGIGAPPLRATG